MTDFILWRRVYRQQSGRLNSFLRAKVSLITINDRQPIIELMVIATILRHITDIGFRETWLITCIAGSSQISCIVSLHSQRRTCISQGLSLWFHFSSKIGRKCKWSNGVGKSEISIIWCISIISQTMWNHTKMLENRPNDALGGRYSGILVKLVRFCKIFRIVQTDTVKISHTLILWDIW